MVQTRYGALVCSVILAMACGCSARGEDTESAELMQVSDIQCSVARGAFVAKPASGEIDVTCPSGSTVTFNGNPVQGSSFKLKPKVGVNILHVERNGDAASVTDIPFLFGDFKAPQTVNPNAIALRIGASGMSNGAVQLPLPANSSVTISQVASQVLRDQGNLLARLDGTSKDVSAGPFTAGVRVIRSSYDHRNVTVVVTPRDRGVHLDATVTNVNSLLEWNAGVAGVDVSDQITASAGKVSVSADVDLAYDGARGIRAALGAHDLRVDNLDIDSAVLSGIPFGFGDGIEDAIAGGAQALLNTFADPLLDAIKSFVLPKLTVSLDQFHLPNNLAIPFLGGSVDLKQAIDGASFQNGGISLSLGAGVMAPPSAKVLPGPGFLSIGAKPPTFDTAQPFNASVSLDYVNQALYAVWKQGLLNRQLSGPISAFGISTEAIVSDAKLPPVILPDPQGNGVNINLGELQLNTIFHGTSGGDAKVRIGVSVVAGAVIELADNGETLLIKPSGDDARTKVVAELIGVPKGNAGAIEELSGILMTFTPVIEAMVGHDLELPPIAIPALDLGVVTPGFAGKKGRFNGALKFDGARVNVQGKLIAN